MNDDLTLEVGDEFQISKFIKRRALKSPKIVTWKIVDVQEQYKPDGTPDFSYTAVDAEDENADPSREAFWFSDVAFNFHRERGDFQLVGTSTDPDQAKTHGGINESANEETITGEPVGLFNQ